MAKIELKAQCKTREEAFGKLVKAMNTHKFNVDDIRESIISISGELL